MQKPVIVFDADGVLFPGGENMKDAAWDSMVMTHPHPSHTTLLDWHRAITTARGEFGAGKGKGSRYDIIALALTTTGLPATAADVAVSTWADAYNAAVQDTILALGIYPETRATLRALRAAGHPLYVNTATPTSAVIESLKALELSQFFTAVYGQPETKVENLLTVAMREDVPITELVFVGDGSGDIRAATEVGCRFIGITNDSNQWSNQPFPLMERLDELIALL
jgi:phosphoglycolate phosphatase-like HAD superfamily hydrolase